MLTETQTSDGSMPPIDILPDAELLTLMAAGEGRCAHFKSYRTIQTGQADPAGQAASVETEAKSQLKSQPQCEHAELAWGEFYKRHVSYLFSVCMRSYSQLLGGEAGVADLVSDAFRLAYEKAGKFRPEGICDPDRQRLRVRAWLGWLARRLVQDILRSRQRLQIVNLEMDWQCAPPQNGPVEPDSEAVQLVRAALESLSKTQQLVIRTTMQWYRPEKEHQRLPDDVAAELAATLKTTPENLRQIRRRAMKKISEYVQQNSPG